MTIHDHPHDTGVAAGFWLRAILVVSIVMIGSVIIRNVTGAFRAGIYGHAHTSLQIR